jgi:peptidylprolyl isomerase/peptidyl-prolyl cis-trans isomerase D
MIAERLSTSMQSLKNFTQLAMQFQTKIDTTNLTFAGYNNSPIGRDPEVLGQLFSCKANELLGPLKGKYGAYVVIIDHINLPAEKQDFSNERMQQQSSFENRASGLIYEALRKSGKIKDNRRNFF